MNKSFRTLWALLVVVSCSQSLTLAQELQDLLGGANVIQAWDYRFDAQYQSTVKPSVRWYMRGNPAVPGTRYLPSDFGFGLDYGYAAPKAVSGSGHQFYSTCPDCDGEEVIGSNGERPSLYWNHLRYLYDTFGHTTLVRREGTRRSTAKNRYRGESGSILEPFEMPAPSQGYDGDPIDAVPVPVPTTHIQPSVTRPVWIHRDAATGSVTVLYRAPPEDSGHQYFQATAQLGLGAQILNLTWRERPHWSADVELAQGRLMARQ